MGRAYNTQIISGGNEQQFKNEIIALTDKHKSRNIDQTFSWLLKMEILKKYTNIFKFDGDDDLERIKPFIIRKLFWNGICGVAIYGEKPVVVPLENIKYGLDGYPVKARIAKKTELDYEEVLNLKELNKTNGCFVQSNVYRWPLFIGLDYYLQPILELFPLLTAELKNAITKVIVKAPAEGKERDTLMFEINQAMQRSGNLISILPSKIGEIVELKSETINEQIWTHIKTCINFLNQRLGFLYNASEKSERNIVSEVAINEMQFTLVRDDYIFFIQQFVNDYNALTNKQVKIVLLQDEIAKKQADMQAVTMLHQDANANNESGGENE